MGEEVHAARSPAEFQLEEEEGDVALSSVAHTSARKGRKRDTVSGF
jgi:hypothetical protein